MKILPDTKFLTFDIGTSYTDFTEHIRTNPLADYWVLKQTAGASPRWFVLPAIKFAGEALKILDEDELKKRLRAYIQGLLQILPETQTVVHTGGKLKMAEKPQPQKSGYLVALKDKNPICIVLPEKAEQLHPKQQKAEIDLTKLSNSLFDTLATEKAGAAGGASGAAESSTGRPSSSDSDVSVLYTYSSGEPLEKVQSAPPQPKPHGKKIRRDTRKKAEEIEEGPPSATAAEPPAAHEGFAGAAAPAPAPTPPQPSASAPPQQPPAAPPVASEPPKGPSKRPPVASGQAYPWIKATPEHVVQEKTFDVEVSLRLTAAPGVRGSVSVPKTSASFTFVVHLLFEDQSRWGELEFNWADETTKAANFKGLTAPKHRGKPDEEDFRTIRVNFYLSNRWCGEGRKNIEILSRAGMPQADEIPTPAEPEWRKYLNVVSTDSAPPDLLVRIHKIDPEKYAWSFLSPHMNFADVPRQDCEIILDGGPEQYIKQQFEPLAKLKTLSKLTLGRLEGTCKLIYDKAVPKAFKDAYWDLYNAAKKDPRITLDTIQFVSDEPFVPWELMHVADAQRGAGVPGELLSVRHSVGRWLADESSQISPSISIEEMAVFASDYTNVPAVPKKLQGAEQEAIDLVNLYKLKPKAVRHALMSEEITNFLEKGKAQVLHFCCHGQMDQQTPSLSVILLEDDQKNFVPALVIRESSQKGIGSQHPLVFLNACQVGGIGADLSFVTGWPQAFLSMGASAVIAPLWSVHDQPAHDIAKQFYNFIISNSPISLGAALQHIRNQFKTTNDMTYLAYLLYGDPTAMVSLE